MLKRKKKKTHGDTQAEPSTLEIIALGNISLNSRLTGDS